jgi:hypothetical protein
MKQTTRYNLDAAADAGSAAKSKSATTNSAAAWIKASTEVTHGTLTAWHARTPVRRLAACPISLICRRERALPHGGGCAACGESSTECVTVPW